MSIAAAGKIFRRDRGEDPVDLHGPEDRRHVRPQHAGIDKVPLLKTEEVGEPEKVVETAERNDIGGGAAHIEEHGVRVAPPEIVRGGEPVCGGQFGNGTVMK